jgi:glycosyltransferase involved in cell wall biosynthesis
MKVIHILHSLKFSGAEIMYVDAAPFFQEKGCELMVMATANDLGEYSVNFKNSGYFVLHKPMPRLIQFFSRLLYYKSIIQLFKINKFDVVHIHSFRAMWGFAFCAWLTNTRSVYTFHSVFPTHFYSYPYHVLCRWSAKHFFGCKFQTISDTVSDHEAKLYCNTTKKIYNWYGNKRYFAASFEEKNRVRSKLGIAFDDFVLISVGGCSDNKRHSDIIKALQIVTEKIPNIIYLHLGKGETESEEKELAKSLGISERIIFCNNQQDVRKYLIASDIYLMTSKYEGISITTIEAMACGIPAILYNVQGLRDFNVEGEISMIIKEDYYLLANSIIELFYDKIPMNNMAIRAKNFVERKFNLEKNADQIFELYNQ